MQKLLGEQIRKKIRRILANSEHYMTILMKIKRYGQNSHGLENKSEH
jgi:hypothetical protein